MSVLTNEQCNVLEKIAHRSGMDCWFWIDEKNRIRDLENRRRIMSTAKGITQLREGMTNYTDYGLTDKEIAVFEALLDCYGGGV